MHVTPARKDSPAPPGALLLLGVLLAPTGVEAAEPDRWLNAVVQVYDGPSLCAGALIDAAGTIATAYHCVTGLQRPHVVTRDGQRYGAEILAVSRWDDVALLRVPELAGAPHLTVRETEPRIGEEVWALGHPMGSEAETARVLSGLLSWSATRGVVSAVGPYMFQVDAPLNPGNSGGPIVDADGALIGVASRKLKADNLGFAARSSAVIALTYEPQGKPFLGGTYGLGLSASLPMTAAMSPSFGLYAELDLREAVVLRGDLGLPVDGRWSALARGESSWVGGTLSLMGRGHVGSGRWSFDLGAGPSLVVAPGRLLRVQGTNAWFLPSEVEAGLGGRARVGFPGGGLSLTVSPWAEAPLWVLGVDLAWPGTLGVW